MNPIPRRRRLVFAAIVVAAFFALAEGVLALLGAGGGPTYVVTKGLRWTLPPNLDGEPFPMRESGRTFALSTNADGLRTRWPPGPAPAGMKTILWLGDSRILGWGVDDGEDVSAWLEKILAETYGAGKWRVIDAGMPGYSSVQSLGLFERLGLRYAPDIVILELAHHNFRRAERTDLESLDPGLDSWLTGFLTRHSRLFRLLRRGIVELRGPSDTPPSAQEVLGAAGQPDQESDEVRVPPDDLDAVLDRMEELARRRGFRLVVVFPCNTNPLPERYDAVVKRHAEAGRLLYLDYATPFRALGGLAPRYRLPDSPGHHTSEGNYLAARAMGETLLRAGLLPPIAGAATASADGG